MNGLGSEYRSPHAAIMSSSTRSDRAIPIIHSHAEDHDQEYSSTSSTSSSTSLADKLRRWLTYSRRPLFIEELADVLILNDDDDEEEEEEERFDRRPSDPRDILAISRSLGLPINVTVVAGNTKDLSSYDGFQPQMFQVRLLESASPSTTTAAAVAKDSSNHHHQETVLARAHALIAEECLAYLLQFNQPYPEMTRDIQSAALLSYTTDNWANHARLAFSSTASSSSSSSSTAKLHNLILEFFLHSEIAYKNWTAFFEGYTPFDHDDDDDGDNVNADVPQPLYYASSFGLTNIVKGLLAHDDTAVDEHGGPAGSALTAACLTGSSVVAKLLVEAGADINFAGPLGTPLDLATAQGHAGIVQILIESGPMEGIRQHLRRRTDGQVDIMRLLRRSDLWSDGARRR